MGEPKDSFEILGLAPNASPEEVKDAYIELARVWRPNIFLDDELLRPIAEQKMVEIDEAYDKLKSFFRSNGYGRSMPERKNASKSSAPERMVCESPGCAGTIGANGECELCGRPSAREVRYAIYCPSCGTRNYLKAKKDYHRGICFQCGVPFRAPLEFNPATSRKMSYLVLLAVLTACAWFFFFSSENGNSPPQKHPVSIVPPQQALSNNVPETKDEPEPPALITDEQQQEAPSSVVSAPLQASPPDGGVPAVSGSGDDSEKSTYEGGD
jgi:hypothetical protein